MPKETITVDIEGNALETPIKRKAVNAVAKLGGDDADRIHQIASNPKALVALKKNWTLLKAMI